MGIELRGTAGALVAASGLAVCGSAARAATPCEPHWLPVSAATNFTGQAIADMTMWDDDGPGPHQPRLVVCGQFTSVGGVPAANIAMWDGRTWSEIGGGVSRYAASVLALADGRLVAAGLMNQAGGTAVSNIAVWDGSSWSNLGTGLSGSVPPINFQVNALAQAANGDVYAAGGFTTAGGKAVNNIARWDGNEWWPLGSGLTRGTLTDYSWVSCLSWLSPTQLLVGGLFGDAGGVPVKSLATWNGTKWQDFAGGVNGTVWSVARASDGTLYATGNFSVGAFSNLARNAAAWDGTQWLKLGAGIASNGGLAAGRDVVVMPDGSVFFGGELTSAGGSPASAIARWNGSQWSTLGNGLIRSVQKMLVLPSGELVVGRDATVSSPWSATLFNRWGSARTAWIAHQPQAASPACGGSATLVAALASGYDAASVTWKRGEALLAHDPAAGVRIEYADGVSTLRLDTLRPESAGLYRCTFDFGCNQVESAPAALTVSGACCPGDLTLDAIVDDQDFQVFAAAYNLVVCDDSAMAPGCPADLNRDGLVDDSDFEVFVQTYNAVVCAGSRGRSDASVSGGISCAAELADGEHRGRGG
ncbi:MAG: hypothetical protein K2Y21_00520 [Phycisphaerales bacterium]|nr:hypothetical protein [Phycisphaerales bacterium]